MKRLLIVSFIIVLSAISHNHAYAQRGASYVYQVTELNGIPTYDDSKMIVSILTNPINGQLQATVNIYSNSVGKIDSPLMIMNTYNSSDSAWLFEMYQYGFGNTLTLLWGDSGEALYISTSQFGQSFTYRAKYVSGYTF